MNADPAVLEGTASQAPVRFRSMQAPSLPFAIALIGLIAVAVIVVAAWSALITMAFALAVALLMMPVVDWLERHGIRRSVAAFVVVTVIMLTFGALVLLCASIVMDQGATFVASAPQALESLKTQYETVRVPDWLRASLDLAVVGVAQALNSLDVSRLLLGFVEGVLGLAGFVVGFSVVPFFMFYVLVDQPHTKARFYRGLPAPWRVHAEKVVEIFRRDFADYFRAEFLVGSIVGITVAVGMLVIGGFVGGPLVEFALLLGLIAAVLELLPSIGPVISYLPALLLAAVTSPTAVVLVSIFYFVVFNIEGSYLVPSVQGKIIDFDRATVLVLLAIGFGLAGIVGGILALPIASIARDLFAYVFGQAQAESAVVAG